MTVRITEDDFDIKAEHDALKSADTGAIVTFTGTVRDLPDGGLNSMTLEHYPGMTESEIEAIITEAKARWSLKKVTVIHRVGRLLPTENIVFVGCSSAHRGMAFDGANFIMDFLKSRAPIWKQEHYRTHSLWVQSKEEDELILNDW